MLQKARTDTNATKPSATEKPSTITLEPLLYRGIGPLTHGDCVTCGVVGLCLAGVRVDGTVEVALGRGGIAGGGGDGPWGRSPATAIREIIIKDKLIIEYSKSLARRREAICMHVMEIHAYEYDRKERHDAGTAGRSPAQAPAADGRSRRQRPGIPITRVMLTATGAVLGLLRAWQRHCGSSCTMLPRLAQQVSAGAAAVPSMKGRQGRRRKRSVLQVEVLLLSPAWGTAWTPATETTSSSSATQNEGASAIAARLRC